MKTARAIFALASLKVHLLSTSLSGFHSLHHSSSQPDVRSGARSDTWTSEVSYPCQRLHYSTPCVANNTNNTGLLTTNTFHFQSSYVPFLVKLRSIFSQATYHFQSSYIPHVYDLCNGECARSIVSQWHCHNIFHISVGSKVATPWMRNTNAVFLIILLYPPIALHNYSVPL